MAKILEKHARNAKELLEWLSPWNEKFQWIDKNSTEVKWYFRGHREAEWKLQAHSRRYLGKKFDAETDYKPAEEIFLRFKQKWIESAEKRADYFVLKKNRVQQSGNHEYRREETIDLITNEAAEADLLHYFTQLADDLGLDVGSEVFPASGKGIIGSEKFPNYDYGFLDEHLALAQHHGIPTRFLDWTGSPLAACFFASCSVKLEDNRDEKLAIWAINSKGLKIFQKESRIHFLRLPRATISYLNAQDSLFLYLDKGYNFDYVTKGEYPSIEDIVEASPELKNGENILIKFTLSYSEIPDLIRYLWAKGIHRARLMPTYDNVTKALFNMWNQTGTLYDIDRL